MVLFPLMAVAQAVDTPDVGAWSFLGELFSILAPLLLIVAALLFALRLVKRRYGLAGTSAPLSVLQVLPLGPRERLVLVQTRAGRVLAVGVSAQSVRLVARLEAADVASPVVAAADEPLRP